MPGREAGSNELTMHELSPIMIPAAGERLQRFVGDRVRFTLRDREGRPLPEGWRARLRTNLGRAELLRDEIIQAHTKNCRSPALPGATCR